MPWLFLVNPESSEVRRQQVTGELRDEIYNHCRTEHSYAKNLSQICEERLGSKQFVNIMMLGVAYQLGRDAKETQPKHLRVGVNSSLITSEAIARLPVAKGIFTELEHAIAQADAMEREVARYEAQIEKHLGKPVKLL